MGDGTKENPYTRKDVLKLIEENGGKAEGLDLSSKIFEEGIDLSGIDLRLVILVAANLSKAHLEGIDLRRANLTGARLRHAHLEEANLQRANLGRANLRGAHLEGANLRYAHMEEANLREGHFQQSDLRNNRLQEARLQRAQLQEADLTRASLNGANVHETQFSPHTKFVRVNWGDYIIGEEKKRQFLQAADIYRQLKMWHINAGIYDTAGEFFFREMTAKRKNSWWQGNKSKPLIQLFHPFKPKELSRAIFPRKPLHWAWSKFISLICGYGEKPYRVALWAASVILGSTLIYFLIGSVWKWWAFWDSLYFSAVSFTALGYGSWLKINNDWIRGIGAFESFIGVFSIALFLVTFTRKMTR